MEELMVLLILGLVIILWMMVAAVVVFVSRWIYETVKDWPRYSK